MHLRVEESANVRRTDKREIPQVSNFVPYERNAGALEKDMVGVLRMDLANRANVRRNEDDLEPRQSIPKRESSPKKQSNEGSNLQNSKDNPHEFPRRSN